MAPTLLQLPPEILIQIFGYLGSDYFRSDLSRLAISKQWSRFAHLTCFQDFYLTQKTLRGLLYCPNPEPILPLLKISVETVSLTLTGFQDWHSIRVRRDPRRGGRGIFDTNWDGTHGRAVRTAWTAALDNQLHYLASIIRQSRRLRTLRIQATSELSPRFPCLRRRDYLYLSTIRAFLSASNLTTLDLDLCGSRLIKDADVDADPKHSKEALHLCPSIAALLTTLRSLRLRMRRICPDVLKPRQHRSPLRLNSVLINLSLSNESPHVTTAAHALPCLAPPDVLDRFLSLKPAMEKAAQDLASQMAAPQIVRVLTHKPATPKTSLPLQAFDALTGENLALPKLAEWDEQGRVIDDEDYDMGYKEKYDYHDGETDDWDYDSEDDAPYMYDP